MCNTDKIIDSEPAPYSKTSVQEIRTVNIFNYLVNSTYVKPFVDTSDKIPNIDGTIDITDENQYSLGKIEVQLKTLDEKNLNNPKYQCKLSFLAHCEKSKNPTFLIVVDIKNDKAYWMHINRDTLKEIKKNIKGETVNVNIPKTNIIENGNDCYIKPWLDIVKAYNSIITNNKKIESELAELKKEYEALSKLSNKAIGLVKNEFKEIHIFLDILNNALDNDYSIVKKIFYPNFWKLGFAFSNYQENSVIFAIYPIEYNKNDLLIKQFEEINFSNFDKSFLRGIHSSSENLVKSKPFEYVYSLIHEQIKSIFRNKLISFTNTFIANEFIIGFVDRYHKYLGLNKNKNKYLFTDIEKGINVFLPLLYQESNNIIPKYKEKGITEIEIPTDIVNSTPVKYFRSEKKFNELSSKIKELIKTGIKPEIKLLLYDSSYNIEYLMKLFEMLKIRGYDSASRVFPVELSINKSCYSYKEKYNSKIALEKLKIFYKNLPVLFDQIMDSFFSKQKSEIIFFDGFNRMIVVLDIKEKKGRIEKAVIRTFYLRNLKNSNEKKVEVYLKGKDKIPLPKGILEYTSEDEDYFKIKNTEYDLISYSSDFSDFPFMELAMQNYLYELLERKFDGYFRKITNNYSDNPSPILGGLLPDLFEI
jgi:hypothetical protein